MKTLLQFYPNLYQDSVALMQLSSKIVALPGITAASAQMATDANIDLMVEAGLVAERPQARPNDMVLVIRGREEALDEALAFVKRTLTEKASPAEAGVVGKIAPENISMALTNDITDATMVLVSTPGAFAAAEAMKALGHGLNVMIFSDNVPIEQEVALKRYAAQRDLLVMGPDCGTAIINGVPLAFANVVQKGSIGVIGASGTGMQEVTCLIDRAGEGISQAIGTGGHDLSEAVGGISMLSAIDQLARDQETSVITLVSKPPDRSVADKVLAAITASGKPSVVCFLGMEKAMIERPGVDVALTLEEAAYRSAELVRNGKAAFRSNHAASPEIQSRAENLALTLSAEQKYLRGLYSGGTFCYEALLLLQDVLPGVQSNIPTGKAVRMRDLWRSSAHTIMDLGDDDFTRGRAHPMIDPTLRLERLMQEAADPETALILLDVVLGYGAHENPAEQLATTVRAIRAKAGLTATPLFIAHICGTKGDPQDVTRQARLLKRADIELCSSNAEAVALARAILESAKGSPCPA